MSPASDMATILGVLDLMTDNFYGVTATYSRGQVSCEIRIVPEQEWIGVVTGEYNYNVNRSLWSFSRGEQFITRFDLPRVGDLITIGVGDTTQRYRVINHDKNQCWIHKHGKLADARLVVCTTEVSQQ